MKSNFIFKNSDFTIKYNRIADLFLAYLSILAARKQPSGLSLEKYSYFQDIRKFSDFRIFRYLKRKAVFEELPIFL